MDQPGQAPPTSGLETFNTVLDAGLYGTDAGERFALLRDNLTTKDGKKPELTALKALMARFEANELRLPELLQAYGEATDARRWPIVAVRPNAEVGKIADRLLGMGFELIPSLATAYRQVGLIPLRVPPEPLVILQLAKRPDLQRIERSWARGGAPSLLPHERDNLSFPDKLVRRDALPEELFGQRDPVRVGLLDSGLDARHPVLQTRLIDQRAFQRSDDRVGDRFGHGTAVAGIILRLCPSASFLSAKVLDRRGRGNLDDALRALGWLMRQTPDLIVCNFLLPQACDERAILVRVLEDLVQRGIPVLVPAVAAAPKGLQCPALARGVISVGMAEAPPPQPPTLLAPGKGFKVPRSVQSDPANFPELQPTGWTCLPTAATSTAIAAGTAALLLRVARMRDRVLPPDALRVWLQRGCDDRQILDPQRALEAALPGNNQSLDGDTPGYVPTLPASFEPEATAPMPLRPDQLLADAQAPYGARPKTPKAIVKTEKDK